MPHDPASPQAVVQRQLDAYDAQDLEAWLATDAPDARQFEHPDRLLAHGKAQIRERSAPRFQEPGLRAKRLARWVTGDVVVDHEQLTRRFADGPGWIERVCIDEVQQGRIATATFRFGARVRATEPTRPA